MIAQVTLPSGRTVIDTGKVPIGLRYESRHVERGAHALMWQDIFTTELPPRSDWTPPPKPMPVSPSWWQRVARWFKEQA